MSSLFTWNLSFSLVAQSIHLNRVSVHRTCHNAPPLPEFRNSGIFFFFLIIAPLLIIFLSVFFPLSYLSIHLDIRSCNDRER